MQIRKDPKPLLHVVKVESHVSDPAPSVRCDGGEKSKTIFGEEVIHI